MKFTFVSLFVMLLSSCTTNYYLCTVDQPIPFFSSRDTSKILFYIPSGKQLIVQKKEKGISYISFGYQFGFITKESFSGVTKYSQSDAAYLSFRNDSTYVYVKNGYSGSKEPYQNNSGLSTKSNGSSTINTGSSTTYSSSKDTTYNYSSGGTVQVKGYYRKDGTYVRPHTRSAPKRKG